MVLEKPAEAPDKASLTSAVFRVYIAQTVDESYGIRETQQAGPQARQPIPNVGEALLRL